MDFTHFKFERHGAAEEEAIKNLIRFIGDDPERPGLKETPRRIIESWYEIFSGYSTEEYLAYIFKTFEKDGCNEMVVLKDIEFYSTCEHHMIPFYGVAHIGYIPYEKIIGISKLARVLEVFSRRLQIQERICTQVADAIMKYLDPVGCGCIIEAKHLCMCARGVNKQHSVMVTSALKGSFTNPEVRAEFLNLAQRKER